MTMVESLNAALDAEMTADDRVVLLGEDIGTTGGVFRVTADLLKRYGSLRVIDMPVSEAGTVGMAVGMCLAGLVPVVEIQFDSFAYPAFQQLVSHLARYRWRTGGSVSMQAVVRLPFGGGIRAPELHSDSPEALFCHMPGLKVVCPSNPLDAYSMLRWAIRHPDPVVFMEPKRLYRLNRAWFNTMPEIWDGWSAAIARQGSDATVVSYGASMYESLAAAELLEQDGISVEVVDLRSLWPLDKSAIIGSVQRTHRLVVVHEAPRSCGVGAEVVAMVAEQAFESLRSPVVRITGLDTPFPMFSLEKEYIPSSELIASIIRKALFK